MAVLSFNFIGDPASFPFPEPDMRREGDRVLAELAEQLDVGAASASIAVRFVDGGGSSNSGGVTVPRSFTGSERYTALSEFAVFLKHETAHHLVQIILGWNRLPPAFINEGLAQSQAEGLWIRGPFGFDYHELSAACLRRGVLLPLRSFIANDVFLSARMVDGRVMAQNASFCQWLIDRWSMASFRTFFARCQTPRIENGYRLDLLPRLREVYGASLDELGTLWLDFLRSLPVNAAADARAARYDLAFDPARIPRTACASCGHPGDARDPCPFCGCHRSQSILILE